MSDLSDGQHALDQLDARVRQLGATLAALGWDAALHRLADELPDAGERLRHVDRLTAHAATRVLDLVDQAQPACQTAAGEADALAERLDDLAGHPALGVGEARAALAEAAAALSHQAGVHRSQAAILTEIMVAQDFQDLSGQVIAKALGILGHAERQLRQLLAQSEGQAAAASDSTLLAGPQPPAKAVAQPDVDDLLASLGF